MSKKHSLIPLFCLASASCLAGTMGEIPASYNKVITLSGGPAWTTNGTTQFINLEPDVVKGFIADNKNSTIGSWELFLGLQRNFSPALQYQFGLAVAASSDATLTGNVWDDGDPEFNNFYYNYKINHAHIAAKGKLLVNSSFGIQPYISGSLGVGFNRSYHFAMTQKIDSQELFPGFNAHTKSSFTYTAGVGLQKAINSHWSIGAGYEFADWGKSALARTDAQTVGTGLTLDHLYSNQLQFSISYYI